MSSPQRPSENGFTLIEVLLAVALVAVIAAMVFSGLYLSTQAIDRARASSAEEQMLRSAMRVMGEELMTSIGQTSAPWMGINAQIDGQPADVVAFLAVGQFHAVDSAQETEMARVIYTREGDRLLRFVRRNLYGITDETVDRLELASRIKGFNVRYFDGNAHVWADEWDGRARNKGPAAVLLELSLATDGTELRTVREWVSIGAHS